jgi:hypothetical protein
MFASALARARIAGSWLRPSSGAASIARATDDGRTRWSRTTQRLAAVNPSSTIRWSVPLKAHGKLKLEYRYKVLIRV